MNGTVSFMLNPAARPNRFQRVPAPVRDPFIPSLSHKS